MKNIHVLPTDKPSRLYKSIDNELSFTDIEFEQGGFNKNQNIYITSDEEIKEGDWCYDSDGKQILQFNNKIGVLLANQQKEKYGVKSFFKIILTDNKGLIKDGVQAIDDDFLEWFVKNPSCEEGEIVKTAPIRPFGSLYKIIIPKEEAKKKHIVMLIGDKVNEEQTKCYCGHTTTCDCGTEEPKQETLEEYIQSLFTNQDEDDKILFSSLIRSGAKWQQERSYSEEDMKKAFYYGYCCENKYGIEVTFNDWFIKFKNK
jgi:hypothetical protein